MIYTREPVCKRSQTGTSAPLNRTATPHGIYLVWGVEGSGTVCQQRDLLIQISKTFFFLCFLFCLNNQDLLNVPKNMMALWALGTDCRL